MPAPYVPMSTLVQSARAMLAEFKIEDARRFFTALDARDLEWLRKGNPEAIASDLTGLAWELQTLASAIGAQPKSQEEEERQVA
jgi:hypothetical protein